MEKYGENVHQNLAPDSFLILLNNPKEPFHSKISFKNKIFWKKSSKSLKKVNFFSFEPFNGQSYKKQKGSGTSDQSLFWLQNKFKKIPSFVIYYLTKFDDVM